jgi:hypothetical protein
VSPEVQDVFLSQREIEQIPGCQAQSEQQTVASVFHTIQPHYAIFQVLTIIALKIQGSQRSDYEYLHSSQMLPTASVYRTTMHHMTEKSIIQLHYPHINFKSL